MSSFDDQREWRDTEATDVAGVGCAAPSGSPLDRLLDPTQPTKRNPSTHKELIGVLCAYGAGEITEDEAEEMVPGIETAYLIAVELGRKLAAENAVLKVSAKIERFNEGNCDSPTGNA